MFLDVRFWVSGDVLLGSRVIIENVINVILYKKEFKFSVIRGFLEYLEYILRESRLEVEKLGYIVVVYVGSNMVRFVWWI